MGYIKGYYDDELLGYFLDLDEEFDAHVSCRDLTIKIDLAINIEGYKLEDVFSQISSRISRLESIGEFETNAIWRTLIYPGDHSKIYFNIPRNVLRGFMGGEKYITIGNDEFRDLNKFVERVDRWIRESLIKMNVYSKINVKLDDISVYKIEIDFNFIN